MRSSSRGLTPIDWKAPLHGRVRSRTATPPVQFTGMDERNTPKSEQLRGQASPTGNGLPQSASSAFPETGAALSRGATSEAVQPYPHPAL